MTQWTELFSIWPKEIFFLLNVIQRTELFFECDPKSFFHKILLSIEHFFNMIHRIQPLFSIWLKELKTFSKYYSKIEPFSKYDSKN